MSEPFSVGPGWTIGPGWNTSNLNGGNSRRSRARRERRDLLLKQKRTQQPMTLILKQEQASYPTGSTNEILQKTEELINIKKLREKK